MTAARRNEMPPARSDIIVVGAGGAGLAAAAAAADSGSRVVVLEKAEAPGGTTRLAVGSVSANSTALQRRAGITDSPEAHYEDLGILAGPHADRDNTALRRVLSEDAGPVTDWLASLGVEFYGPLPEPPHRQPRMHVALPNAGAYITRLRRAAARAGATLHCGMTVERLVRHGGRVRGVQVRAGGWSRELIATTAVILTSGDFSAHREMREEHLGGAAAAAQPINPHSSGDGHRLALEVGARLVNADIALGPELRFPPPKARLLASKLPPSRAIGKAAGTMLRRLPRRVLSKLMAYFLTTYMAPSPRLVEEGAVLVNGRGMPVGGEDLRESAERVARAGQVAYLVFDGALASRLNAWPNYVSTAPGLAYAYLDDYQAFRSDIVTTAPSLAELAGRLRMDAPTLRDALADRGTDPAAVRGSTAYWALGPLSAWMVLTDGGLAVDEHCRVLGADASPIDGLYAAGSVGQGGLILNGHGHHLMWAFVSGRRAHRVATGLTSTEAR